MYTYMGSFCALHSIQQSPNDHALLIWSQSIFSTAKTETQKLNPCCFFLLFWLQLPVCWFALVSLRLERKLKGGFEQCSIRAGNAHRSVFLSLCYLDQKLGTNSSWPHERRQECKNAPTTFQTSSHPDCFSLNWEPMCRRLGLPICFPGCFWRVPSRWESAGNHWHASWFFHSDYAKQPRQDFLPDSFWSWECFQLMLPWRDAVVQVLTQKACGGIVQPLVQPLVPPLPPFCSECSFLNSFAQSLLCWIHPIASDLFVNCSAVHR